MDKSRKKSCSCFTSLFSKKSSRKTDKSTFTELIQPQHSNNNFISSYPLNQEMLRSSSLSSTQQLLPSTRIKNTIFTPALNFYYSQKFPSKDSSLNLSKNGFSQTHNVELHQFIRRNSSMPKLNFKPSACLSFQNAVVNEIEDSNYPDTYRRDREKSNTFLDSYRGSVEIKENLFEESKEEKGYSGEEFKNFKPYCDNIEKRNTIKGIGESNVLKESDGSGGKIGDGAGKQEIEEKSVNFITSPNATMISNANISLKESISQFSHDIPIPSECSQLSLNKMNQDPNRRTPFGLRHSQLGSIKQQKSTENITGSANVLRVQIEEPDLFIRVSTQGQIKYNKNKKLPILKPITPQLFHKKKSFANQMFFMQ